MSERIAAAATNGGAESTDLPAEGRGSVLEVLGVATRLGLTSFGVRSRASATSVKNTSAGEMDQRGCVRRSRRALSVFCRPLGRSGRARGRDRRSGRSRSRGAMSGKGCSSTLAYSRRES
jgi:hypothetical protein